MPRHILGRVSRLAPVQLWERAPSWFTTCRQVLSLLAILPAWHPSVLTYDVMRWWVRAGALAFPLAEHSVGERCSMPEH